VGLEPIARENVAEVIAVQLRESIQSGVLKPGDKLVERSLAESLGVSHIPIREALARLTEEGLVQRTPRRVARVSVLSRRDLEEISSLRIVLESFAARLLRDRWSEDFDKELMAIVKKMMSAASGGDTVSMFELDSEFHQKLWEMSDHQALQAVATQLRRRINGFVQEANSGLTREELRQHALSHQEIVEVLRDGDDALIEETIASHVNSALERMRPKESAV